jgi:hypothetical protein
MEPPTYKLDKQGYISQVVGNITDYLCGISVAYKDCWVYKVYWTSDWKHALNVFDLCKVWNKVTATTIEYENMPIETLVGITSNYVTHQLPYKLSAGSETVYLGTYQISTQRWAYEELTPEWLHASTKPATLVGLMATVKEEDH